jgi:Ca-activated chloride channel family protein
MRSGLNHSTTFVLLFLVVSVASAQTTPLALSVHVEALGKGSDGMVVGAVLQIAPEDRDRAGERVRVVTTLRLDDDIVDRQSGVVVLQPDGTAMLYREWDPGTYMLEIAVVNLDGTASGIWLGEIEVATIEKPFEAPEGAPVDAIALDLTPPREGGVSFKPPPNLGGLGAVQLEVEVPDDTASVEFFHDGSELGRRNRPPWTVSIPLGEIIRRTEVRAVALDARGTYLGEDAVILNNPSGQIGVRILLAPESTITNGRRTITVATTSSARDIHQVSLSLDDEMIARWAACPCVVEVSVAKLQSAAILSAEAVDSDGTRGDAVYTLGGGGGFVGSVRVELVELPVVVLDQAGVPVTGLTMDDFTVREDGEEVNVEGFGTTADLPLSLAIAVDTSGSMIEDFPKVQRAVRGFTDELLEEGDQAVLIRFSWDATVQVRWTDNIEALVTNLEGVVPEGGTSLHDAVVRSLEQFRGRRGRQAVVLLTDGEDTTSRTDWGVAERFAHTMRIPIFSIGLGVGKLDFASRNALKSLATTTGGEAFFPKKVDELPTVYTRIAELLRSQYLLWYPSPSDKPPEEFRSIEVTIGDPEATVRTISGYYPGK